MTSTETITPYEWLGGDAAVRALTRRFYDLMDSTPQGVAARAIHRPSLADSEEKLFEFLSGWLGGPQLFIERRGPPMLRARHLHVKIGKAEIDSWIACFRQAWFETAEEGEVSAAILAQIESLATHMANVE